MTEKACPREPTEEMIEAAAQTPGMKACNDAMSLHQARGFGFAIGAFDAGSPLHQAWRAMFDAAPGTRPSPSTVTDEGLVDHVARAICWKFSEETDDCSSVCLNAKKCMADDVGQSFIRDAKAALEASGHTALLSAVQALGVTPEGYCFCSKDRIGDDSKIHEPECADVRAALSRPLEEPGDAHP